MQISTIPKDFIINVATETGGKVVSNFLLHGLKIKNDTKVKQGHTGMSGCPHLHFQLMDGPDFLADRGLPCSFSNIRDVGGDRLSFIEEENIIVHAE